MHHEWSMTTLKKNLKSEIVTYLDQGGQKEKQPENEQALRFNLTIMKQSKNNSEFQNQPET